jgi:DnaJ-class molecular chaperone
MSKTKIVEKTCPDCDGRGYEEYDVKGTTQRSTCPICDGTGAIYSSIELADCTPCPSCNGKGYEWIRGAQPGDVEKDVCRDCEGHGYVTKDSPINR